MTGILYFSSTGNSLQIATQIRSAMGGTIRYIPTYQGTGEEFDQIILVSPIYSFGLPVHVYDLIPKLTKERPVWVVLNYGGMSGGADAFTYRYALEHGVQIKGVYLIRMPENYTLIFSAPQFYVDATLRSAPKAIEGVIQKIQNEEPRIPKKKRTKEALYLKNRPTWHLIARDFSVTEDCVKCGKCVELCPTNNISLTDGEITFADRCVICLGCYHRCPKKAIRYRNNKKQDRYLNPTVHESDIGKDL